MRKRIASVVKGGADLERREAHVTLIVDGKPADFVAKFDILQGLISGLAQIAAMAPPSPGGYVAHATKMRSAEARSDPLHGDVLLRLESDVGAVIHFVLPTPIASTLAQQLKSQCAQVPRTPGTA